MLTITNDLVIHLLMLPRQFLITSLLLLVLLFPSPATSQSNDGFDDEETEELTEPVEPEDISPLNPLGDSIDSLTRQRINEDIWIAMLGELPCGNASRECLEELQALAVADSRLLAEIDARIEEANVRIDDAKSRNKKAIAFDVLSPALQYYLSVGQERGRVPRRDEETGQEIDPLQILTPLEKIASIFGRPTQTLNTLLDLIGIPIIQTLFGGNDDAQRRSIDISELSIRVGELQRGRSELAQKIRESVVQKALDLDSAKKEFQGIQELLLQEADLIKLLEITYRFGGTSTETMVGKWQELLRQKISAFRAWGNLQRKLSDLKLLVNQEILE